MEGAQIISLYFNRDQSAIVESDGKYGQMLRRISFNVVQNREDSDECVNDTYLKAWDTIPPQKPGSLAAYLGRITRNISINRWHENNAQKRGGKNLILTELSDCIPSSHSVEKEIEAGELAEIITKWLCSLAQDDRVLFLRRYWFGDGLKELAEECASTPNKLAGRMYRLREKLKLTLEKEGVYL
jgi:RNA polymerase sigma-70 factor (ECF subfamily)